MIRPILLHPDLRLRMVCEPVGEIDDGVRQLAADMLATMYAAAGAGLAAPQVGVLRRVIVMDCAGDGRLWGPMAMVNPWIVYASSHMAEKAEGCLSMPGVRARVRRPWMVSVRWLDLRGHEREITFQEERAACVQHELDHLDGRLIIDHGIAVA